MDFGLQYLNFPRNIPRSLAELLTDGRMGGARYNPGECAYLPKCFAPEWAAIVALPPGGLPNVMVFLNSTVVRVDRDASSGRISESAQRSPPQHTRLGGIDPSLRHCRLVLAYAERLLQQGTAALCGRAGVVVEATEFGDVLVLADGLPVGQGVGSRRRTAQSTIIERQRRIDHHLRVLGHRAAATSTASAAAAGEGAGAGGTAQAQGALPNWLLVRH